MQVVVNTIEGKGVLADRPYSRACKYLVIGFIAGFFVYCAAARDSYPGWVGVVGVGGRAQAGMIAVGADVISDLTSRLLKCPAGHKAGFIAGKRLVPIL